jgi:hypothetical protein
MYEKNKQLFENGHTEVYREDLKRIDRVIGNFDQVISFPVIFNFQKRVSLKIADLLFGEPPQITAGDKGSKQQTTIEWIEENSDLQNTAFDVSIDVSRYGDGLLYVRDMGENKGGKIDLSQPSIWFPVVSPDNVREYLYHVLAWKYTADEYGQKKDYLKIQIHDKGQYIERTHSLDGGYIGKPTTQDQIIKTGIDDFAIIPIHNIITSDRATGLDDYSDIDSIIAELIVRVGQVAKILDKHADPSMSGPASALEKDPQTGEYRILAGNYFQQYSKEDAEVKYITWDGQLSASFTMIEKLINMLYTISEMGSALFGDLTNTTGQIPSGSALKRLLISPLAKVNRIRMRFDPALKKAITLCSQLGGEGITDLSKETISISWQDGLPTDEKELTEILQSRTAQKATISQKTAIMRLDGLGEEAAEEELAAILDDEAQASPFTGIPTGDNNVEGDTGGAI